jgi:hypothetical protein
MHYIIDVDLAPVHSGLFHNLIQKFTGVANKRHSDLIFVVAWGFS